MAVRVAPHARRHLDAISEYIRARNPTAASRVRTEIRATLKLLSQFPFAGHEGTAPATREIVVPGLPYIIVHIVEPKAMSLSSASIMVRSFGPAHRSYDATFSGLTFNLSR